MVKWTARAGGAVLSWSTFSAMQGQSCLCDSFMCALGV